uniref:Methyl-CpG-binding domain protein 1 n=1 Tax=Ornithorhynchus anatinus TaxID=9258 RepID=A0A6I8PAD0_ORNAN
MVEDWMDCPALGPGWKRRESFRKSGATCGRTDTYYQSPTGERFRSKIELTRFLGPDQDLSLFDFKNGVVLSPDVKVRSPGLWEREDVGFPEAGWRQDLPPLELRLVPLSLALRSQGALRSACLGFPLLSSQTQCFPHRRCENCRTWFSRGNIDRNRRFKSLCSECRGRCGQGQPGPQYRTRTDLLACQETEDCGSCPPCVLRLHNPESQLVCKCVRRRCLKIIKRGFGCGVCQGCQTKEDCGTCQICLRKLKPGLKRQWKCLQRRCLKVREAQGEREDGSCGVFWGVRLFVGSRAGMWIRGPGVEGERKAFS